MWLRYCAHSLQKAHTSNTHHACVYTQNCHSTKNTYTTKPTYAKASVGFKEKKKKKQNLFDSNYRFRYYRYGTMSLVIKIHTVNVGVVTVHAIAATVPATAFNIQ